MSPSLLVDLHMHTTWSDGVWSTERLLDEVRARNLDVFCISDHDTLDAYPLPDEIASRAIPGLEVDSHHGGHTVHILAYGVHDSRSPLLQALAAQRKAREDRMAAMVEVVNRQGIPVTMAEVRKQATGAVSLGRPHLARALVARGAVATVQEAFDRYLADDGNCYVALARLTSDEAIQLIHASGGVAVAAHPMRLHNDSDLAELIALDLDGIEVIHPTADAQAERELRDLAASHDLLVTGGTDFHAPVEGRPIGVPFDARDIERLREAIAVRAHNELARLKSN